MKKKNQINSLGGSGLDASNKIELLQKKFRRITRKKIFNFSNYK